MDCGKLTAKLRDMVTVRFYEGENEVKRYHNIEVPDEVKKMEFKTYEFCVPVDGSITFKIWLDEHVDEWPEARKRKTRENKEEIKYTGDRKTVVMALEEILNVKGRYLGTPTYAYEIGEVRVERDGTVTGLTEEIRGKLKEMGFQEA